MSKESAMILERRLAELVARDAPPVSEAERHQAVRHITDLVGVALAGTHLPVFDRLVTLTADQPLPKRLCARIWGTDRRVPLQAAGSINGFAGHVHDFDDDEVEYAMAHITVTAATAAMVVADALPSITGENVVEAYIIAAEVAMRIGEMVNPEHYREGWHATSTLGAFAACAAAGRLLDLEADQMHHALGMCSSFASGIRANFGSDTKPLQVGEAVRKGIMAVEAAKAGLTSAPGALLGPAGYGSLFQKNRDLECIVDGFGKPYRFLAGTMVIKAYPCCTASHTSIFNLLALKTEYGFSGRDIATITCQIDPTVPGLLVYDRPENETQAKFSMPYSLAVSAEHGKAGITEFSLQGQPSDTITSLMERVVILTDPHLPKGPSGASMSSRIEIELKDGRRLGRFQEFTPGSANEPLSDQDLENKFVACLSYAPPDAAKALFAALLGARSTASFSTCIDRFGL